MRYWLLTTEYPPFFGGGIATYCYYTARMLARYGHDITVFVYDAELSQDEVTISSEGIRVIRFTIGKTRAHKFLGFNASVSYEYAETVRRYLEIEGAPDILESQEYHGISYYVQQFKHLGYELFRDLNVLITCHAPSFLCLEYNHVPVYQFPYYWTGQMEKASIRSADLLISPSRYFVGQAKERMNWEGIKEKYLLNPIEVENNSIAEYKEKLVVCFGKLSPLKGTFELLQYFKKLWDNGFDYTLHIVGGTQQIFHPEAQTMEAIVKKKYGTYIERKLLKLEGELSPEMAKQKMQDAHVVVVPSKVDNLPYTVLEAMSWGKVVLASCQGGQQEIIRQGHNGFLFDHLIVNDFQEKLVAILKLDVSILKTIGQNAIQTIRLSCSPETVYAQKNELIASFLEKKYSCRNFPFIQNDSVPFVTVPKTSGLLSVVIPYYNMGEFVEECIQSILASDYSGEKEIIVVNDGSTDKKSLIVLEELVKRYSIKVYHKENEGLPLTRNYGAWKARGTFLAFLDADDTVEKTYYGKAINVLNKYDNVHFVGCWTQYFGIDSGCWPTFNPEPPYLLVHNMINSSALVYKRDSFLSHGLNDPELVYGMEDYDSVINMVEKKCGGVVLPEPLFNYRVRKDSMARAFTRVKQLHLYRVIGQRHKALYNQYGSEIAQLLNANGSGIDFDNPTVEPPTGLMASIKLNGLMKERIKQTVKRNKYLRKVAYTMYKSIKTK